MWNSSSNVDNSHWSSEPLDNLGGQITDYNTETYGKHVEHVKHS